MIKVKNISHGFDKELFIDINIDLKVGDSLAITGRSGSGKSTLLHIMSSFLKPNKGIVIFDKKDIYKYSELVRRKYFGIIFQDHFLLNGMTVKENLKISENISEKEIDNELLKELGIYELIDKKVSELSGGQKQRVSIARVLVKKPLVIFGDEITANLDKETRDEVLDMLFEYKRKNECILILVTHDDEVSNRCLRTLKI